MATCSNCASRYTSLVKGDEFGKDDANGELEGLGWTIKGDRVYCPSCKEIALYERDGFQEGKEKVVALLKGMYGANVKHYRSLSGNEVDIVAISDNAPDSDALGSIGDIIHGLPISGNVSYRSAENEGHVLFVTLTRVKGNQKGGFLFWK